MMDKQLKIIYFCGPKYSGSTYIRSIISYLCRSRRACLGNGDKLNGDGALCEKTLNYSKVNWIPNEFIQSILEFENIFILTSHFVTDLNLYVSDSKYHSDLPLDRKYKFIIIRNPVESVLSTFMYKDGDINKFQSKDWSFLETYFKYYFVEKKQFEKLEAAHVYYISYSRFLEKNSQALELEKITRLLDVYNKQHLKNYIEAEFEIIKNHIHTEYLKARQINKTNSQKKINIDNNIKNRLTELILQKIQDSDLSLGMKKSIISEMNK